MDNVGEPLITYSTSINGQDTRLTSESQLDADGEPKSIIANAIDSYDNEAFCQFTLIIFRQGM